MTCWTMWKGWTRILKPNLFLEMIGEALRSEVIREVDEEKRGNQGVDQIVHAVAVGDEGRGKEGEMEAEEEMSQTLPTKKHGPRRKEKENSGRNSRQRGKRRL